MKMRTRILSFFLAVINLFYYMPCDSAAAARKLKYSGGINLKNYNYLDAKRLIESHDVISFDILDTLLVRPYAKPEDLFIHLKKLQKEYGFTTKMPDGRGSELEKLILQPHTENVELFNYAKSLGKKVIIVSDMYLHGDFLAKVLRKNGITGWNKLYVSSDLGVSKHQGKLFDYVLKDLSVKPKSVLHLGDSLHTDIRMAKSRGIDCFYTPKLLDRLFAKYPRFKKYYNEYKGNLTASIFVGTAALNLLRHEDDYWYNFGYLHGGPILYAYTKWLLEEFVKDGKDEILFVGRDGYNLQKIFEMIKGNKNIRSHYFYAPRAIVRKYLNATGDTRKVYQNYLDSLGIKSKNIAFVESITGSYSVARLLDDYFEGKNVKGYYYTILKFLDKYFSKNPKSSRSKVFSLGATERMRNWDLIEFFMSEPCPKVVDIRNNFPVYTSSGEYEKNRIEAEIPMYKGIIDFAKDAEKSFKGLPLFSDNKKVDFFSNILSGTMTDQDLRYLDKIRHTTGNTERYKSLFDRYKVPNKKKTKTSGNNSKNNRKHQIRKIQAQKPSANKKQAQKVKSKKRVHKK